MRRAFALVASAAAVVAFLACKGPVSAVATGACSIIEAFDDSGGVQKVCATAEDLAVVVDDVNALRASVADAGGHVLAAPGTCTTIPSTNVCATNGEMLHAIARLKAMHSDGGHQ